MLLAEEPLTAGEWLSRIAENFHKLNYQGVFTYQYGERMEALQITHAVVDGEEYERLQHLDGERREVVRHGDKLTCIHPGRPLVELFQREAVLKSGYGQLEDYYRVTVVEGNRVAGRDAVSIRLLPRDHYRYGYDLLLDRESGLLLRSELLGIDGRTLERFQFTQIMIGAEVPTDWVRKLPVADESADAAEGKVSLPAESAAQPEDELLPAGWHPLWLPAGFEVASVDEGMRVFSDGLAVVSVFLERLDADAQIVGPGRAQRGATVAYTRLIQDRGAGRYVVTVIGEVPQVTAKRIADSVALDGGARVH